MKKLILLLSVFLGTMATAQNWSLVMPNDTLVYEKQDDNQLFTVWVDSLLINGSETTYFLNLISPGSTFETGMFEMCDSNNWNGSILTKKTNTKPQFLGTKVIAIGTKRIIDYSPDSYIIFPQKPVGASWVCDSSTMDSMTIISADTAFIDLYQVVDSVKILRFKNKDLYLSKNHGLLSGFDLRDSTQIQFDEVGVQNLNLGIVIPMAVTIFNFEVGDLFYRESGGGDSEEMRITTSKIHILSKNVATDSVFYSVKINAQTRSYSPHYGGETHYFPKSEYFTTLSFPIYNTDGLESAFPHTLTYLSEYNLVTETFVFINDQNIIEKRCGQVLSPTMFVTNAICENDSFSIVYYPNGPNLALGNGIGNIHFSSQSSSGLQTSFDKLIGYKKVNGNTWGDITYVSVGELDYSNLINIFPNPTNITINIITEKLNGISVLEIYDLKGRLITTKNFESGLALDVSEWNSGVYFTVIKDSDGAILHREKIIIQ